MLEEIVADRVPNIRDSFFQLIKMAFEQAAVGAKDGAIIVSNCSESKDLGVFGIHLKIEGQASGQQLSVSVFHSKLRIQSIVSNREYVSMAEYNLN